MRKIAPYRNCVGSVAELFEASFYDGHDCKDSGSSPSLPFVACLDRMLHNNYPGLVESDKQQIKEVRSKTQPENSKTKATSKRVWICPMHSASVAFS